jgi:uncharacterized protein YecT (DUF1311 family)
MKHPQRPPLGRGTRVNSWWLAAWLAVVPGLAASATDATWMLRYIGRSTDQLRGDPKMPRTLRALVPGKLVEPMEWGLGGPPDPVEGAGPAIWMFACVPHACGSKAFLWVDTFAAKGLAASADCRDASAAGWSSCKLSAGSLAYTGTTIPPAAITALKAWITEQRLEVDSGEFTGRDGRTQALSTIAYQVPEPYRPATGGPSFDCAKANTEIDRAVCGEPALAALDLQLDKLYREVLQGTSDLPSRDQLRRLERDWLHHRDQACANPTAEPIASPASTAARSKRSGTGRLGARLAELGL